MRSDRAQDSPQQGIQSIEVGSKVLLALEAGRGPLALSEVAERSGVAVSKRPTSYFATMRMS